MAIARLLATTLIAAAVFTAPQTRQCNDMWPAWSPDGRSIVFASDRTGDIEIFVSRLGEPGPRQLTNVPGRDAHPAFSPDGRLIAFQSPRGDGHTNLYTMRPDGSDPRKITNHEGFAGVAAWSPDGQTIAYQWTPQLNASKWRLMLLDVASGRSRAITDGAANDQVPNWSPDGARIAFYSDRSGKDQLYVRARDGAVTPLLSSVFMDKTAAWSPDGKSIAFISERNGEAGVYLAGADGSGARRVGSVITPHGVPFFSPDGTRVFATPRVGEHSQIWSLSIADGTSQVLSACGAQ